MPKEVLEILLDKLYRYYYILGPRQSIKQNLINNIVYIYQNIDSFQNTLYRYNRTYKGIILDLFNQYNIANNIYTNPSKLYYIEGAMPTPIAYYIDRRFNYSSIVLAKGQGIQGFRGGSSGRSSQPVDNSYKRRYYIYSKTSYFSIKYTLNKRKGI